MAPRSEYGLPIEYLNLKYKGEFKVRGVLWRPEIRAGIDNYASNESLHVFFFVSNSIFGVNFRVATQIYIFRVKGCLGVAWQFPEA